MRLSILRLLRRAPNGVSKSPFFARVGQASCYGFYSNNLPVEIRILVLNADPVFEDATLGVIGSVAGVEIQIVRTVGETVTLLLEENFDALLIEGEASVVIDQATNVRQHFPSLPIGCLLPHGVHSDLNARASRQNIRLLTLSQNEQRLQRTITKFVHSVESNPATPAEGIDPCHSLIGNLNQFSAAEILQMSCLSQRTGRFTLKSSRGTSEIYLQHGSVRHAVFGSLEGETAVAEVFRWRQGRFYFEEGIISQEQTVDRPWAHLLIDNLQKLDETLELVSM